MRRRAHDQNIRSAFRRMAADALVSAGIVVDAWICGFESGVFL